MLQMMTGVILLYQFVLEEWAMLNQVNFLYHIDDEEMMRLLPMEEDLP